MSLKHLLGLGAGFSDEEIMAKISEAMKKHVNFIEIKDSEGGLVKIHIPTIVFDEQLMYGRDMW